MARFCCMSQNLVCRSVHCSVWRYLKSERNRIRNFFRYQIFGYRIRYFVQYLIVLILNPILFYTKFVWYWIRNHLKNGKVSKPKRHPKYPKSEQNRIQKLFPIPNFFDTESNTFSDSKLLRYRIQSFFGYQFFLYRNHLKNHLKPKRHTLALYHAMC